jgi:GT2 family glycosyltransferase
VTDRAVSIVVPTWNGEALLARNLPSLLEAIRCHPGEAELIVVDDGSTDGTLELLRRDFPTVRPVIHRQNRGFGEACLSGVLAARHPLVALFNSDAHVEKDFLAPLTKAFDDPLTFASCPLILDREGDAINTSLRVPYVKRGKIRFRRSDARELQRDKRAAALRWYTLYPVGGACLLDRERFLALGGFDPLFHPFYYEDQDLGFRAWRRGWHCCVVPSSQITHEGGETINRFFDTRYVNATRKRNRVLFVWKNFTTGRLFFSAMVYQVQRVLLSLLRLEIDQAWGSALALRRIRTLLQRRSEEKRAAVRSEREIFEIIERTWRESQAGLSEGPA